MPTNPDILWFKKTFGADIVRAVAGTPFTIDMLVAIACQETGPTWSVLRRKQMPVDRILALCVGDTIDYRGPGSGRQAFPRNRAHLLSEARGPEMFAIARKALVDMAVHIRGYRGAAANPEKFCRGFGVFQRDLQFFRDDPDYFLDKRYELFADTLAHCLTELRRGLRVMGYEGRRSLTDYEFACVAIVYNTGRFRGGRGLRQGYFNGERYYGEEVYDFVRQSKAVAVPVGPSRRYRVIARDGLRLRGGPGTGFPVLRSLPLGTVLTVVAAAAADPAWVQVDLEDDGRADGYVFASFLEPIDAQAVELAVDEVG